MRRVLLLMSSVPLIVAARTLGQGGSQASTALISGSPSGAPGDGHSYMPGVSADGRYICFESRAYNLVPGAGHWAGLIYVHDSWTNTTVLANPLANGSQPNIGVHEPNTTASGRQVVFATALPLIASDVNGVTDVYFSDVDTGALELLSVSTSGVQGNAQSIGPRITPDGRYVAFTTLASTFVPGDVINSQDVFLRDRATGTTELITIGFNGLPAAGTEPTMSADGRYVAFSAGGINLVPGDTNGRIDVFLRDRTLATTTLVSVRADGVQGNDDSGGTSFGSDVGQSISADGRYVAFRTRASNLLPGDSSGWFDIAVKDLWTGTLAAASVSDTGQLGNETSFWPRISSDGRWVVFFSRANNLVVGDTNGMVDVFMRDMFAGTIERVSLTSTGLQANSGSEEPAVSADGRRIAFSSPATNLVPGHFGTTRDIFLRTRALDVPQSYCAVAPNSLGCTPPMSFTGSPSASGQPFELQASQLVNNKLGRLAYSTLGGNETAFAGGLLCLRAPIRWTAAQFTAGNAGASDCSGTLQFDFDAWIASGRDPALVAGQQVWTQWFTRDGVAASTLSLTGGLTFVIAP